MFRKVWELFLKYKEMVLYLVFGGLTTLVNIVTYALFAYVFNMGTVASTALAWIVSVIFAYITNKIFVFESKTDSLAMAVTECVSFFGCRLATGIMDIAVMYVSVDLLHFNDIIMKIVSNVLVVVLNYIFSKLFIFKKEEA